MIATTSTPAPMPAIAPRLSGGFPRPIALAITVDGGGSAGGCENDSREISNAPEEMAPGTFPGGSSRPVMANGSLSSGGGVADVVRTGAGSSASGAFFSSSDTILSVTGPGDAKQKRDFVKRPPARVPAGSACRARRSP